ncbi:MAG: PorT family protein [Ignavibacteriaceae bacterium]|jgi:hypothetical protein|nr:PorT family protein [Ignavibacteriaceae bacterium]
MLKYGLCFIIFLLFSFTLSAQPGIKGGLAVSALQASGEDYTPFLGYEVSWLQDGTSNPVFGLQLGLFYTFNISDEFIFQPELYFAERGYQFDQTPLYDINYSLGINYLELPLLIEYYLPLGWGFHPAITAGPYSSIKLSNNKKINLPGEEINGEVSSVNNFDYGIVFGIATEFAAWNGEIIFDLRVNWGLANVLSQPSDFISINDDPGTVKTRAVTLMTGYRFSIDL